MDSNHILYTQGPRTVFTCDRVAPLCSVVGALPLRLDTTAFFQAAALPAGAPQELEA